jgi:hypothetical protein
MIIKFKDPDDIKDFKLDWSWLAPDYITASTWFMNDDSTLVIDDDTEYTAYETVVWVSGGTEFETVTLTNRVTTSSGRRFDYSILIKLKHN